MKMSDWIESLANDLSETAADLHILAAKAEALSAAAAAKAEELRGAE